MSAVLEWDDSPLDREFQDVTSQGVDLESLVSVASRALGPEYSGFRLFESPGSARICLLADWKPLGLSVKPRTRIVKIDREEFASDNAERVTKKGYTTRNDVEQLLAIPNPESHHIVQSLGYLDLRDHGWDGALSVESYFPSLTLEQYVAQHVDSIGSKDAVAGVRRVFSQVLDAERYLVRDNGILHRDVKPSNILVNDSLEVRLTDLANGGSKDDIASSCDPTYGGHLTADPRLMMLPSGVEAAYDERSEIHSLGKTLLFALSGRNAVEYDKTKRTAVRLDTGASILDDSGQLSISLHDAAVADACRELRGDARKYSRIIQRSTTLDRKKQYQTIDELISDFEAVDKPGVMTKVGRAWRSIAATAGIVAIVAASVAGTAAVRLQERLEDKMNVSVVQPGVSESTFEIMNDYVEMDVRAYSIKGSDKNNMYPDRRPYLKADPGDHIAVSVSLKHRSHSGVKEWNGYMGKIYFEGYTGARFTVGAQPFNEYVSVQGGYYGGFESLTLTDDIKQGVRDLIVEIYAPNTSNAEWNNIPPYIYGENAEEREKKIKRVAFPEPLTVIAQKRIHVIVGDEKTPIAVGHFWRGDFSTGTLSFTNPRGNILSAAKDEEYLCPSEGMTYELTMPDVGYHNTQLLRPGASNSNEVHIGNLPDGSKTMGRTALLEIVARNNGREINRTYLPLRWNDEHYDKRWELIVPRADFGLRAARLNAEQHGWPQPKAGSVNR